MINKNLERDFPSSDNSYKPLVSESKWDKAAMLELSVRPSLPLRCLILGDIDNCLHAVFSKMMKVAKIQAVTDLNEEHHIAIKWSPRSHYQIPESARKSIRVPIINDTHFDCKKSNVAMCFEKCFGYSLSFDPRQSIGRCVMKSERNATHDGRIIECPVPQLEPHAVYMRLVSNEINGNYVEDIRIPIIGRQVPFAYLKYRPITKRFSNKNSFATLVGKSELFSQGEITLIKRFAREIGLDYGELDVLRDRGDGRIYIVDANNTPHGPPNGISEAEGDIAVRILADTFLDEFLAKLTR
jgi:hypothetical protein